MESKMFVVIGVDNMVTIKTDSAQEAERIAVEMGYLKDWEIDYMDSTEAKWDKNGVLKMCISEKMDAIARNIPKMPKEVSDGK